MTSLQEPTHAVLEQAAEWYARLRDGHASGRERTDWQAWIQADEMHKQAWRYVEDIGRSFAPLQGQADTRQAVDSLHRVNHRLLARRRSLAGLAALAAGSSLLGWWAWRERWLPNGVLTLSADHRSGLGEQREITLADGTQLWLNTDSAVNLYYSQAERRIALLAGEIFIATAPDARPFIVETSQGWLQPLGTRFNVHQDHELTQVAVYEGAVEIRPAQGREAVVVAAGRQASFSREAILPVAQADPARLAWTQGTLVADNIPLREVVRELRRYRKGHLGLQDEIADLLVYGHFPLQDTDRALRMLTSVLPVRVAQPWPWWTRIEAA